MKKRIIVSFTCAMFACMSLAAGPGGGGTSPGGGGMTPGGGGNQPGGGSSATFTFDTFLASSTATSGLIIREGVIIGYASPASVTVASTVTDIAEGALAGCTTLASIDLSATSITEIPDSAFAGCSNLAMVILPSTCTTIGANAFAGCTKLATLTAPGATTVGDDSFRACSALSVMPSSVRAAGAFSFAQSGLTSVDLAVMASVGEGAFAGCESLTAATVAAGATLPNALFAGCTALDVGDWSAASAFGQAALAGIPATTLTISPSATLGAYAFAADAATVATTLDQSALPACDSTAFLGREVSYVPVSGSVARIEANDLVDWLLDAATSAGVTQPSDYNTATLKAWLSDSANAYAYAYADDLAADEDFTGLTVSGSRFIYNAPSDSAISISATVVASYTLSADESDWSADNLTWSNDDGAYLATDTTQAACFARLRFTWDW